MKKHTTLLTIIFLLCSCSSQQRYENVSYVYQREKHNFSIDVNHDGKKDYSVDLSNVYYVRYNAYTENEQLLLNEFFVNTRTLIIYG